MGTVFRALALLGGGLLAVGCQTAPPPADSGPPPLLVPSTSMLHLGQNPPKASLVLTNSEDEVFIARGEKAAYGAIPIAGFSAFTTYTYDSQPIGTPFGSGYRYRWVMQQGASAPLAP